MYVENVVKDLLDNPRDYFSNGYLNSEGWKKINVIAKVLTKKRIWISKYVERIRNNPDYENVIKVLIELLSYLRGLKKEL